MTTLEIANRTRQAARHFTSNRSGSVVVEYVVVGALIGAGAFVGIMMVGDVATDFFGRAIAVFNG